MYDDLRVRALANPRAERGMVYPRAGTRTGATLPSRPNWNRTQTGQFPRVRRAPPHYRASMHPLRS